MQEWLLHVRRFSLSHRPDFEPKPKNTIVAATIALVGRLRRCRRHPGAWDRHGLPLTSDGCCQSDGRYQRAAAAAGRYSPRQGALDPRSREGQGGEVAVAVAAATPAVDSHNIP